MPEDARTRETSAEPWKDWQAAWEALYNTMQRTWHPGPGDEGQGFPAPWREMMAEAYAKMQSGENAQDDPLSALKQWYAAHGEKWSKLMEDAIGSAPFIEAIGRFLESYASFRSKQHQVSEACLAQLQLPARSDLARLARLIVNLEEKVEHIEDSLEGANWSTVSVNISPSLQRLEVRLGQIEHKLERMLLVLKWREPVNE